MLPVGKYMAKATRAQLGFADTGTEVVAVQFEIAEGENKGALVTWRGYFTEKTAKRAIESLKYCGWSGDWDTWEGLGSQVAQLDIQEDRDIKSGEVRGTRVAWVNPANVPMKNSMDPSQRATFAARMRGIVTEVMGATVRTAQRAPAASTGPRPTNGQHRPAGAQEWDGTGADPSDDNIPFMSRGAW